MKKLLILLSFTIISNFANAKSEIEKLNLKFENGVGIACGEYSVQISIGIASVSTTVYICCGDMFAGPPPSIPCRSVSKKFYDLYQANQSMLRESKGIDIKELFPNVENLNEIKFITILSSSVQLDEHGNKTVVKKGEYPVINGMVNLESEILK
jgi:hypothetical protein